MKRGFAFLKPQRPLRFVMSINHVLPNRERHCSPHTSHRWSYAHSIRPSAPRSVPAEPSDSCCKFSLSRTEDPLFGIGGSHARTARVGVIGTGGL